MISTSLPTFQSYIVTNAPDQRAFHDGSRLPFVLSPPGEALQNPAAEFVAKHRIKIEEILETDGAVLFRGFPLATPKDFNTFVEAFDGYHDLSYESSMSFAVRKQREARICTTNEGKSGGLVFHHEQAQTPLWPSRLFFCCELPAQPGDGGETGIVSSSMVYERLKEGHPEFCSKLEREGVRYTFFAGPHQDPTKGAGRSWKSFFHVSTKEECEAKMQAGGWSWEWGVGPFGDNVGGDFLKCTTPLLEAVKTTVGNKQCFFNQLIATTANALEFSKSSGGYDPLVDVPTQEAIDGCVRFGSGDSISLEILLEAKAMCEDLAVNVAWQAGDVLLVNNYLVMHARRPWKGPEGTRKLLASLVQEDHCTSFGKTLVH